MTAGDVLIIVDAWESEFRELCGSPDVRYVSIFESRGEFLGVQNPHPHSQIWSHATVPNIPAIETLRQEEYLDKYKTCLLCSYAETEAKMKARIVAVNEHFLAVVPFWAAWPYEVLVVPRRHITDISGLSSAERAAFADMLRSVTIRYDNLHVSPFPYAMAVHQRPVGGSVPQSAAWHFHVHFIPPMARNGTSRKVMTAYELQFMPKRDNTPEEIARKLRGCSDEHYTKQNQKT
jgi:UDPglucose--hexose-1-phosphate uridylyltransferase